MKSKHQLQNGIGCRAAVARPLLLEQMAVSAQRGNPKVAVVLSLAVPILVLSTKYLLPVVSISFICRGNPSVSGHETFWHLACLLATTDNVAGIVSSLRGPRLQIVGQTI
ncbi:MAG TPA: hypothetical protein VKZ53_23725 [Candidatus Angelobacter sp.]|nr:hypothetical protein [Candidatus Angelobacter sp.]